MGNAADSRWAMGSHTAAVWVTPLRERNAPREASASVRRSDGRARAGRARRWRTDCEKMTVDVCEPVGCTIKGGAGVLIGS